MNNERLIVEERSRDIGNFLVGRLLPFREKRQVGPFTFVDHMGPTVMNGKYMDVDQHPHIGLSTLTYLFDGAVEHRDSTGAVQEVGPGDVGFMTSGGGVAHTERTPSHLRSGEVRMHGYQLWVALPKEKEEMTPRFDYVPSSALPRWQEGNLDLVLVAGKAFGRESSLPVYSPLFLVECRARANAKWDLSTGLYGELAIVIVEGSVQANDEQITAGQMLVAKSLDTCSLEVSDGAHVLLFGGEALAEPRYLFWNFVSSSKERLEQAKTDWRDRKFPKIPGDDTYIPLP